MEVWSRSLTTKKDVHDGRSRPRCLKFLPVLMAQSWSIWGMPKAELSAYTSLGKIILRFRNLLELNLGSYWRDGSSRSARPNSMTKLRRNAPIRIDICRQISIWHLRRNAWRYYTICTSLSSRQSKWKGTMHDIPLRIARAHAIQTGLWILIYCLLLIGNKCAVYSSSLVGRVSIECPFSASIKPPPTLELLALSSGSFILQ